jgi:protoheme IX farnesyltransferase
VVIYTHFLKRHSTQNIVIGGAAGAIPPLVGWAAVTGNLSWAAWIMFVIIFLWTPPHFWSLALMIRDDYAQVGVPMLPVVAGDQPTTQQIFGYTLVLIPVTLLLIYPLHTLGALYGAIALLLGGVFVHKAWKLLDTPDDRQQARSVFKYSILYLMLLCGAMAIDTLPVSQTLTTALTQEFQTLASLIQLSS